MLLWIGSSKNIKIIAVYNFIFTNAFSLSISIIAFALLPLQFDFFICSCVIE